MVFFLALKRVAWIGPSPRASREHLLIVRTLRAKGAIQGTLPLFFNSLLELVLRYAIPKCIAGELEEPACFGNIAACALQRFL